jgi:hypothetical protein
MALGDFFPDELRNQFSSRSLERGTVLRTHFFETNPPKIKFFVVLGASKDKIVLGVVLINSHINPQIFRSPAIRSWHIPILARDYDFLDHDSFVDCTQIFEKSAPDLQKSVSDSPQIVVGKLENGDLLAIQQAIKEATTIAKVQKRKFGLA